MGATILEQERVIRRLGDGIREARETAPAGPVASTEVCCRRRAATAGLDACGENGLVS